MSNKTLCTDVLINVNRITTRKCDIEKYIEFAEWLDETLKRKYGKYYICDQVNESRDYSTIFYVEAFYRDIDGVYSASEEINEFVEEAYDKVFGDCIQRESITTFREVNKVYPRVEGCKEEMCNEYCENYSFAYEEMDEKEW